MKELDMEVAKRICDAIAATPKSLQKICRENPDLPSPKTIYRWLAVYPVFSEMYLNARAKQVEPFVDEIIDIAYDSSGDTMVNEKGEEICNREYVIRSRLKIDTLKWFVSKLCPKIYGDKIQVSTNKSIMEQIMDKINNKPKE